MDELVTIAGALGAKGGRVPPDGGRVPPDAELIEKIQALPWEGVSSKNLARIAWCETDSLPTKSTGSPVIAFGWLWVQFFTAGGNARPEVYVYEDVPECVVSALREAASPGRAHARLVKGHYRYAGVNLTSGQTFTQP